jgi:hypothetical protein
LSSRSFNQSFKAVIKSHYGLFLSKQSTFENSDGWAKRYLFTADRTSEICNSGARGRGAEATSRMQIFDQILMRRLRVGDRVGRSKSLATWPVSK